MSAKETDVNQRSQSSNGNVLGLDLLSQRGVCIVVSLFSLQRSLCTIGTTNIIPQNILNYLPDSTFTCFFLITPQFASHRALIFAFYLGCPTSL